MFHDMVGFPRAQYHCIIRQAIETELHTNNTQQAGWPYLPQVIETSHSLPKRPEQTSQQC